MIQLFKNLKNEGFNGSNIFIFEWFKALVQVLKYAKGISSGVQIVQALNIQELNSKFE